MAWIDWATGVLEGIGAPVDATNLDTLWAWSGAESLPRDRMSWLNPLNTTLPWLSPPSHPMNSVGVQAYLTEASGIAATVATLLNGYYPVILANLRASVPAAQWDDACANLNTWGTGCGWIHQTYGDAPGVLEIDMTPEQDARLTEVLANVRANSHGWFYADTDPAAAPYAGQVTAKLKAAAANPTPAMVDLSPVLNALAAQKLELAALAADLTSVKMRIEKDLAP